MDRAGTGRECAICGGETDSDGFDQVLIDAGEPQREGSKVLRWPIEVGTVSGSGVVQSRISASLGIIPGISSPKPRPTGMWLLSDQEWLRYGSKLSITETGSW